MDANALANERPSGKRDYRWAFVILGIVFVIGCLLVGSAALIINWQTSAPTNEKYGGSSGLLQSYKDADRQIFLYDYATGVTTRLTYNDLSNFNPQVYGAEVVWQGSNGSSSQIFVYDAATGVTTQITDNDLNNSNPQVYDGKVVWQGGRGKSDIWGTEDTNDTEIFLYDAATNSTMRITDNGHADYSPLINDGKVVWLSGFEGNASEYGMFEQGLRDVDIYLYDIGTNTTKKVTDHPYRKILSMQVADGRIVWASSNGTEPDNSSEIFLYDIATGTTTQVTKNSLVDMQPYMAEGKIVWQEGSTKTEFFEMFLYDIADEKTTQLTDSNVSNMNPYLEGGKIAWEVAYFTDQGMAVEINIYDIQSGVKTLASDEYAGLYPKISKGKMVWEGGVLNKDGAKSGVFLYDIGTREVTDIGDPDYTDSSNVQVSDGRVVWQAD